MSRIHFIIFIFDLLIILLVENVRCRRTRIHQGMTADNSFNYVVNIYLRDFQKINGTTTEILLSKCSGSLVTNQHVITAAHCVTEKVDDSFNAGEYKVYYGSIDLESLVDGTYTTVKKIYIPSFFNYEYGVGDIAVLKLEQPLSLNKISVLTLPKSSEDPSSGIRGIVAGYGFYSDLHFEDVEEYDDKCVLQKTSVLSGKTPRILQYAQAEILSQSECINIHKQDNVVISEHYLCARMVSPNKNNLYHGVCYGDSGGPLVIGHVLVGVVSHSFSKNCDERLKPQIYTRVSHFVNFINDAIKDNIDDSCTNTHIPKITVQIEREEIKKIKSSMKQCLPI